MKSHLACHIVCHQAVLASQITSDNEEDNSKIVFAHPGPRPIHFFLPPTVAKYPSVSMNTRRHSTSPSDQVVQLIDLTTENLQFSLLGRMINIKTRAMLKVLFFKMLDFSQIVQADILSQIG